MARRRRICVLCGDTQTLMILILRDRYLVCAQCWFRYGHAVFHRHVVPDGQYTPPPQEEDFEEQRVRPFGKPYEPAAETE